MVGIVPNEASIVRLVGTVLMEQKDEWQLQHRDLTLETMAEVAGGNRPAVPTLASPDPA